MPRFFIHSRRDGEIVRDVEGQELPGLEAAQAAYRSMSSIAPYQFAQRDQRVARPEH